MIDARHRGDVFDVVDETIDGVLGLVEEAGEEVDTDHAAAGGDVLELSVGEVAMMVAQRPGAGVGGDHGPGGELEYVTHACSTQMGDVEEDAEAFHLGQSGHPSARQTSTRRVLATAVGQSSAPEVGQRGDPDPEPVHRLEQLDVGVDARTTLQRQHQGDPAGRERRVDGRPIQAEGHVVGVGVGDPVSGLDHPQGLAEGAFGSVDLVDEHRQHLYVDAAVAQLGQPVVPEVAGPLVRGADDHRHQQVVVGVGDDRRPV